MKKPFEVGDVVAVHVGMRSVLAEIETWRANEDEVITRDGGEHG